MHNALFLADKLQKTLGEVEGLSVAEFDLLIAYEDLKADRQRLAQEKAKADNARTPRHLRR